MKKKCHKYFSDNFLDVNACKVWMFVKKLGWPWPVKFSGKFRNTAWMSDKQKASVYIHLCIFLIVGLIYVITMSQVLVLMLGCCMWSVQRFNKALYLQG